MSMPERIWRIVRGRWLIAEERLREVTVEAEAARELDEALPPLGVTAPYPALGEPHPAFASSTRNPQPRIQNPKSTDPLAADLALLGAPPACDMATLDRVYAQRLAELRLDQIPVDSPERGQRVAQRAAIAEAYERLRDAINVTETRFEKLEF